MVNRLLVIVIALAVIFLGYLLISKYFFIARDDNGTEKILSVEDLGKAGVELGGETSDASVDNLTKELKAKIDKQIASKENPISTVQDLVSTLCSTVNVDRPTQCVNYIKEFLDTKMDSLKLESHEYGQPDELQITAWRAQFYADLVYGYEFIIDNKLTGTDGQPIDAAAERSKYINMYLELAQNPSNWGEPHVSEADGSTWYYYEYKHTNSFVEKRDLMAAGVNR